MSAVGPGECRIEIVITKAARADLKVLAARRETTMLAEARHAIDAYVSANMAEAESSGPDT